LKLSASGYLLPFIQRKLWIDMAMMNDEKNGGMNSCHHPPLAEVSQLLICRNCHAAKMVGLLVREGGAYALRSAGSAHFSIPLEMVVDPALLGRRVRVTLEAMPEDVAVDS
jgi:hypothetical protein